MVGKVWTRQGKLKANRSQLYMTIGMYTIGHKVGTCLSFWVDVVETSERRRGKNRQKEGRVQREREKERKEVRIETVKAKVKESFIFASLSTITFDILYLINE